jgi:hypothetical protein
MHFCLQQWLIKQILHRGKKERGPDLAGPRKIWARSAQPARWPAQRLPKWYGGLLSIRLDRDWRPTAVVLAGCCMRGRSSASARVSRRGCSPRSSRSSEGGNRSRSGRGRQAQSQVLHAEAGSARVLPRCPSVYGDASSASTGPGYKWGRVRSGCRGGVPCIQRRSREGEGRVDGNLHPCRRSTRCSASSGDGFASAAMRRGSASEREWSGGVIRLKHIYNFWCSVLVFTLFA